MIVSNTEEVELINEPEMLLHPRTKKPTNVFWMILILVFVIVYYFASVHPQPKSHEVNPKLLVNVPDHEFQQQAHVGDFGDNDFERQAGIAKVPVTVQPVKIIPQAIDQAVPQAIGQPAQAIGQAAPQDQRQALPNDPILDQSGKQKVVLPKVVQRGGFANPQPLHREPVKLRAELEDGMLDLGNGLKVRKDTNPDYVDALINNQNPENKLIIPKFNPNKQAAGKKMDDYAFVKRPDPKSFPVDIVLSPTFVSCQESPVVAVLVTTTLKEGRLRATIRRTWGKKANMDQTSLIHGDWKVFFLMGRPKNDSDNEPIVKESQINNDIIQGDFIDIVEEETRKVLMGMWWVATKMAPEYRCQPTYVLRAEADMYINMPSICGWLKSQQQSNFYVGNIIHGDVPNRDVESPYYVSKEDYARSSLPDYADTPVYLMSYDNVRRFLAAISAVTPIAMDGVYMGLLAENVGAKPTRNDHFTLMKRPSNVCLYKRLFFMFKVTEGELIHIYNVVERHYKQRECSRTDF